MSEFFKIIWYMSNMNSDMRVTLCMILLAMFRATRHINIVIHICVTQCCRLLNGLSINK